MKVLFAVCLFTSFLATGEFCPRGPYISKISFAVSEGEILRGVPNIIYVDMNKGSGGKYIYPVIHYTYRQDEAIAGLAFIQDNAGVPSGYTKIDQDLNEGAGGPYNYLCYTKVGANKMTAIDFIARDGPRSASSINGYFRFPADLNKGGGGSYVYLLYQTNTGNSF